MRGRRRIGWWGVAALVAGVALAFPRGWGPWTVERLARAVLREQGWPRATVEIRRVTPYALVTGAIHCDPQHAGPSIEQARVRFSPLGLCRSRIDAIAIAGLRVSVVSTSNGVALAGGPMVRDARERADPTPTTDLGWTVGRFELTGFRVIRTDAPDASGVPLAAGDLVLWPDATGRHRVTLDATVVGDALHGTGTLDVRRGAGAFAIAAAIDDVGALLKDALGPAAARLQTAGTLAGGVSAQGSVTLAAWRPARVTLSLATAGLALDDGVGRHVELGPTVFRVAADGNAAGLTNLSAQIAGGVKTLRDPAVPAAAAALAPVGFDATAAARAEAGAWQVDLAGRAALPVLAATLGAGATGLVVTAQGAWAPGGAEALPWTFELGLYGAGQTIDDTAWAVDAVRVAGKLALPSASGSIDVEGGALRIGGESVLTGARAAIDWAWHPEPGLRFTGTPLLDWDHAGAAGLEVRPGELDLASSPTGLTARLPLRVEGSAVAPVVAVAADWGASTRVAATLELRPTAIPADDTLVRLTPGAGTGLTWDATVAVTARVEWATGQALHVSVDGLVTNLTAADSEAGWRVGGLATGLAHAGPWPWAAMPSLDTTFREASVAGMPIDGGAVRWRPRPGGLFLERADIAWCGGHVRAYALLLQAAVPDTDCILYLEGIDLGRLLALIKAFDGAGTGQLYGRIPLRLEKGSVRLSEGFLYSLPGTGGTLTLHDNRALAQALEGTGLNKAVRKNVLAALAKLNYSTFRLDLVQAAKGEAELRLRVAGESARAGLPPVDLNLNVRGPLEGLLNLGLHVQQGGR